MTYRAPLDEDWQPEPLWELILGGLILLACLLGLPFLGAILCP